MDWAVPHYPRSQVDKAGDLLAGYRAHDAGEWLWAIAVLNNWRSAHSFPLNNFQTNLRAKVRGVYPAAIIAQRIKRLESIVAKLGREQTKTLQLSQMQDIGGCRAVLKTAEQVHKLVEAYKRSKFAHKLVGEKDYINCPKDDGYRGCHLIYQYQNADGQITAYNKLRIEVQIRSQLQHTWATAVEAVGAFTRQALKSNQGSQDWLRLFQLMGTVFAKIEYRPAVYGTPTVWNPLKQEILDLAVRLKAVPTLKAHRATLSAIKSFRRKDYLLVRYIYDENKVTALPFRPEASQEANEAYTEAEKNKKLGDNVVLVKVDSLRALTRAYPNFLLDTQHFTDVLARVTEPPTSTLADVTRFAQRPR